MIIFALRHADKPLDSNNDVLTEAGEDRAKLLARMLLESGITVAYRSEYERARLTLKPLQEQLGSSLLVKSIPLGSSQTQCEAHVRDIVQAVKSQAADAVIVVVSHSNTVPLI